MKTTTKQVFNPLSGNFDTVSVTDATKDVQQLLQLTADEPLSDWTNITGGFSISKVDPLFGDASYVLEMTNLRIATYKVVPVDIGFRGTTVALTLNYLMPQGAARVSLLDQDNEVIEGATFDIPAANGKEKFGTTVFIPSTVTGIRFKMEARATVASQSIKFDNIEISSDLLKSVDIEGEYQSEILRLNNNTFNQTTDLSSIPVELSNSNSVIYTKSTQGITLLRDAHIRASINIANNQGAGARDASIFVNGVIAQYNAVQTNAYGATSFIDQELPAGTKITFVAIGGYAGQGSIQISATARTKSIVAPTDIVTERSIAFKFKSTALTASDPIGTYNTYTYAANTSTKTLATTRPTQTDADMSVNGVRIFTRAYNAASTAAQPARFEIKIAEPNQMAACDISLFKDVSRLINGRVGYSTASTSAGAIFASGLSHAFFNPSTGLLTLDAGYCESGTVVSNQFIFSDNTGQDNGYICFTASKLAQGVAIPIPARYVVKTFANSTANPSLWYEVYNDGWVRQGGRVEKFSSSNASVTLLIPMSSNLYNTKFGWFTGSGATEAINKLSTSSATVMVLNSASGGAGAYIEYLVEGYGASSVVKQYGANPTY